MTRPDWLSQNPQIRALRVAAADLNGQPRGKRLPVSGGAKALAGGTRFPLSVMNLDIWGDDIENSPLVMDSGDRDGVLLPTERGFVPMPWLGTPTALLPIWMHYEDGTPFPVDPRQALNRVLDRYRARGLTPVVAVEMEFFLIDDSGAELRMPRSPLSGKRRVAGEILSMRMLDMFDTFFTELYDACDAMDIPADTAISESGLGQFEMNLNHVPDALKAADDAWLFKLLVKGLARNHNFAASFMAKPYADYAGSGMHMHFSVLDSDGRNVFDDGTDTGTDMLQHAVAGCMAALAPSTLIFAPHANSYDRLVPGAHAPTAICWAYENRTAAIRVPSGPSAGRRIEHRVAGGDVNPYLSIAAVLGAAMNGIEDGQTPPPAITGNAYDQDLPQIPADWDTAMDQFESSPEIARIFDPLLIQNLLLTKRQEARYMEDMSPDEELDLYLGTV